MYKHREKLLVHIQETIFYRNIDGKTTTLQNPVKDFVGKMSSFLWGRKLIGSVHLTLMTIPRSLDVFAPRTFPVFSCHNFLSFLWNASHQYFALNHNSDRHFPLKEPHFLADQVPPLPFVLISLCSFSVLSF